MMRLVAVAGNSFLFDYKVVNSALDNLLISGSEIFIDFSIKRGVDSPRGPVCLFRLYYQKMPS